MEIIPTKLRILGLDAFTLPTAQGMPTLAPWRQKPGVTEAALFTYHLLDHEGRDVNPCTRMGCRHFLDSLVHASYWKAPLLGVKWPHHWLAVWCGARYFSFVSLSVSSVKWGSESAYLPVSTWGHSGMAWCHVKYSRYWLSPLASQKKPGHERESLCWKDLCDTAGLFQRPGVLNLREFWVLTSAHKTKKDGVKLPLKKTLPMK